MVSRVKEAVSEAFANASDNGFGFQGVSADEIVNDMMDFDADIATMRRDEVHAAVVECLGQWKAERA